MSRTKTPRPTISLNVGPYTHVLIEQSSERTPAQKGAYMGMSGYVLHRIVKREIKEV